MDLTKISDEDLAMEVQHRPALMLAGGINEICHAAAEERRRRCRKREAIRERERERDIRGCEEKFRKHKIKN